MMHVKSKKSIIFNPRDIARLRREVEKIPGRGGANAARKLARLKAAIDRLESRMRQRGG